VVVAYIWNYPGGNEKNYNKISLSTAGLRDMIRTSSIGVGGGGANPSTATLDSLPVYSSREQTVRCAYVTTLRVEGKKRI
jgi:hypothetical protein